MATILSLIIAALLYYHGFDIAASQGELWLGVILLVVATAFLILPRVSLFLSWTPLQRMEEKVAPRLSELFQKDRSFQLIQVILLLFPFITYMLAIDLLSLHILPVSIAIPIWILLFGIALDTLFHLIRHISGYFDPFHLAEMFTKEAKRNIQNDEEAELCQSIDSLSEMALRALSRSSLSLCNHICDELQRIVRLFFESAKSIAHPREDSETKKLGISDKVSYTLFFFLQRLEMINSKAVELRLEPVSSHLVTVAGKTVISSAKCDISLPTYPLIFLGKLSLAAQHEGMAEVGSKATCTLIEVARAILTDQDVTYLELQEPFFSLITQLDNISKEMFRKDKSLNVKILTQPFLDLRNLFSTEKMASHPDTAAILQRINSVLGEYEALEAVLRTKPPISINPNA